MAWPLLFELYDPHLTTVKEGQIMEIAAFSTGVNLVKHSGASPGSKSLLWKIFALIPFPLHLSHFPSSFNGKQISHSLHITHFVHTVSSSFSYIFFHILLMDYFQINLN